VDWLARCLAMRLTRTGGHIGMTYTADYFARLIDN
jgi:hypothetical protein